jgi:hypothetical protein
MTHQRQKRAPPHNVLRVSYPPIGDSAQVLFRALRVGPQRSAKVRPGRAGPRHIDTSVGRPLCGHAHRQHLQRSPAESTGPMPTLPRSAPSVVTLMIFPHSWSIILLATARLGRNAPPQLVSNILSRCFSRNSKRVPGQVTAEAFSTKTSILPSSATAASTRLPVFPLEVRPVATAPVRSCNT